MTYPSNSGSVSQDMILSYFQRWQRLEEEKSALSEDLKELFAEAKGMGFDTKVMRKVFRDKTADANDRAEFEAVYELYSAALGMSALYAPPDEDDEPRAHPARAREVIEEFDTETGEILEPTGGHTLDQGEGASAPALSPSNPVAKASAGNAVNATTQGSERAEPQDWNGGDGAGEASRASEGAGSLAPISQAGPDKPAEVETSAAPVAPGKRRWTFTDKAHADCLNPEQCGGFSNLGLCTACKTAAGVAA